MPGIQNIIRKHVHLLRSSPQITEISPAKSIFHAYLQIKNLKEILLLRDFKLQSSSTGWHYHIHQKLTCSSKNVTYLAMCCKCNLQYVGSTSTESKIRFHNHKSNMLNNRRTYELVVHRKSSQHDISQMRFIIIEKIISFQTPLPLNQLLFPGEAYWMTQ